MTAMEIIKRPLRAAKAALQKRPPPITQQLRISSFQPPQARITQRGCFLCSCKHHDVPQAGGGG